jgi:serine/threonine-protein kinase HipA
MKSCRILRNGIPVGVLNYDGRKYTFAYDSAYLADSDARQISLTLPLREEPYVSDHFFSFFFNMLSEGVLKEAQCRDMKIDEEDYFTRLVKTCAHDTIGSITVKEITE